MTIGSIIHPAKFSQVVLDTVMQAFDEYMPACAEMSAVRTISLSAKVVTKFARLLGGAPRVDPLMAGRPRVRSANEQTAANVADSLLEILVQDRSRFVASHTRMFMWANPSHPPVLPSSLGMRVAAGTSSNQQLAEWSNQLL